MALKVLITVLSFLVVTDGCQPCYDVVCKDTSSCRAGVTKDICGCCNVCAKSVRDSCGGLFNFHGKCGTGLECVNRRPNSVKILGENDFISGTCEPSACSKKKCGFNQRCQLNKRGKARCVCPRYCKSRYMPVCGLSNGKHYWNRCFLRKDECKVQRRIGYVDGPCKKCHENGKAYKFGEKINRDEKCEICTCVHGNWRCVQDSNCPTHVEICEVGRNDCPEGFQCREGSPDRDFPALDGIGICLPKDNDRTSSHATQKSGDSECSKLNCRFCRHGYQKDSQGCETCKCIKGRTRKNICQRPKFTGPCLARWKRYYYNSRKRKCVSFIFGGCFSNGNNFPTKKKCETKCKTRGRGKAK